ncbi:phytanoyl-CoA dioxygenase family protein [Pectobacterium zantedeschiae]|uniref:Phytanoyl-CoA dioxygenase n=1 Tax=Pectobacterium zantedeschiae TaxID=2034769 RepID=A0A9X8P6X8_9GAMM|nr:phytanoyl-CoA dioxygenase family protein [Pectobacterium zantedeschiae]RYC37482.1 hypothetical protein CTN06_21555 [Pectobacterium zantedeschiae]RYC45969.1 hypothetical protein CLR69_13725 [Pectobacterium zantedeschiae]
MLTEAQILSFKREGVLILHDVFTVADIEAAKRSVLNYFCNPGSASEWFLSLSTHSIHGCIAKPSLSPLGHQKLAQIYHALHRQAIWEGEDELIIRPHEAGVPWCGARAPHLDFPINRPLRTLANNVIYLTDVRSQGGAFMYWPGSHRVAWDYFRKYPDDYLAQGESSQDQVFSRILSHIENEPVEFLGKAGDVLIWNSLLLHSASINTREETRIASFGRWGEVYEGKPYDFSRDIWSYWDFAV